MKEENICCHWPGFTIYLSINLTWPIPLSPLIMSQTKLHLLLQLIWLVPSHSMTGNWILKGDRIWSAKVFKRQASKLTGISKDQLDRETGVGGGGGVKKKVPFLAIYHMDSVIVCSIPSIQLLKFPAFALTESGMDKKNIVSLISCA